MANAIPVATLEFLQPGLEVGHGIVGFLAGNAPTPDLLRVITRVGSGIRISRAQSDPRDEERQRTSHGWKSGGTDALPSQATRGRRLTCGTAETGENDPLGVQVKSVSWDYCRISSTPHLESLLRSIDDYPDAGSTGHSPALSGLSTTKEPSTNTSNPVSKKHLMASRGLQTIGSPFTLKDVFSTTYSPVRSPNALIRAW